VGKILSRSQCNGVGWFSYSDRVDRDRYIVDSADRQAIPVAREELHFLLQKQSLSGIPLLVLGNKCDLPNHLTVDELIEQLNLKAVEDRKVSCYCISAKEETNLDAVLQWLIRQAND
jgi:ADP-ribosylation factor-like protein 8